MAFPCLKCVCWGGGGSHKPTLNPSLDWSPSVGTLIFSSYIVLGLPFQAFRFMVGPGHCPMISKYGPSLSKAVGPVDPSILAVKKSHFNKNIHLTVSL